MAYDLEPQRSKSPVAAQPGSRFYRMRIENYGLTPAKKCIGRLIGVYNETGKQIEKFDPLPLFWARQDGKPKTPFRPIDIQGFRDFYFLDIAQQVEGKEKLWLRVYIPPGMTLIDMKNDPHSPGSDPILIMPGVYFLKIAIYSKEACLAPKTFRMETKQDSENFTVEFHEVWTWIFPLFSMRLTFLLR